MKHLVARLTIFVAGTSIVSASNSATFEPHVEGSLGTTYVEGGITFFALDNAIPGSTPPFIAEQADGSLTGQPGFTSPNVLGFGGYSPGPGCAFSRCKSFRMTTGGLGGSASLELWGLGNYAGNTVTLEATLAGALVASQSITWSGGFTLTHHTLSIPSAVFDELRLVGAGASDSGAFFAVIDSLTIGAASTGTVFCVGDGSATPCPCGNASPVGAGEGCTNSLGLGGKLRAIGAASLSADTVTLEGEHMPNAPALYFQGTSQSGGGTGLSFGDGLRCAAGTIVRLGTKTNVLGASEYPEAGDLPVSTRGLVTLPGTRTYQVWYRNAAAFCTSSTFNLTNGLEIAWLP